MWEEGEVVQTLYLPAISVWSVCVLPSSGDIAAATNDGCVRVFTRDPSRQASQEVQEIYEAELSKVTLAAQQNLGGVKLTDLPGPEALYEPGAKDGQQKMVTSKILFLFVADLPLRMGRSPHHGRMPPPSSSRRR